jgi:hypothetical protein
VGPRRGALAVQACTCALPGITYRGAGQTVHLATNAAEAVAWRGRSRWWGGPGVTCVREGRPGLVAAASDWPSAFSLQEDPGVITQRRGAGE